MSDTLFCDIMAIFLALGEKNSVLRVYMLVTNYCILFLLPNVV